MSRLGGRRDAIDIKRRRVKVRNVAKKRRFLICQLVCGFQGQEVVSLVSFPRDRRESGAGHVSCLGRLRKYWKENTHGRRRGGNERYAYPSCLLALHRFCRPSAHILQPSSLHPKSYKQPLDQPLNGIVHVSALRARCSLRDDRNLILPNLVLAQVCIQIQLLDQL
jgi:hypothetical protein